mmetsp:Transcript_130163/g.224935  ORF Transcript_130163/g.224935 Transcript_130163/m.224935 type:complete len:371 (+) Transcript_130163:101-1213(+)
MQYLLSKIALLLLLASGAKADGCFERFGSDKISCTATDGKCLWVETDGVGKCVLPSQPESNELHIDGCFERFGADKAKCLASEGKCEWRERDGKGGCVMPRGEHEGKQKAEHGGKREDGCFARFGTNKTKCMASAGKCEWLEQNGMGKCVMPMQPKSGSKAPQNIIIFGELSLIMESPLTAAEVVETINQHRFLLESALADSHGYRKVVILSVSSTRRLGEIFSMRLQVPFQAEKSGKLLEAMPPQPVLEKVLQERFEGAALDVQVQSATVEITSEEVMTSPVPVDNERDGFSKVKVGALIALIGFNVCFCACLLCAVRWLYVRRAATKKGDDHHASKSNEIDKKQPDEVHNDIASASTGTPSTLGEFSV